MLCEDAARMLLGTHRGGAHPKRVIKQTGEEMPRHGDARGDLLTIRQAAEIAGRSYTWARDRARDGRLETLPAQDGRTLVTASSVAAAIARDAAQRRRRPMPGGHLRLIVDNTQQGATGR